MSILTSASLLCFLLFLFIYSSLPISFPFLHYLTIHSYHHHALDQCIVSYDDIVRRTERLVNVGVIEKVPGSVDSLRSVAYAYLSEQVNVAPNTNHAVTNDVSMPSTLARATGADLFNHLKIVLGIKQLPSHMPGIDASLFNTNLISWMTQLHLPTASKTVIENLMNYGTEESDASHRASTTTMLNEIVLSLVYLLHAGR